MNASPHGGKFVERGFYCPTRQSRPARASTERANLDAACRARAALSAFATWSVSPLRCLDAFASDCGVEAVFYKDESNRLGLRSFKALGAPYALLATATEYLDRRGEGETIEVATLAAGGYRERLRDLSVSTATDGNHGKALAWAARQLGCPCHIYLHEGARESLEREFHEFGAAVVRVAGNYDDAVVRCAADAATQGHEVISDTSYPGYETIPRLVMDGYGVLCLEAFAAFDRPPTHVFVQAGVGSLAAAVFSAFQEHYRGRCPRFVIVEPRSAACLFASAVAGTATVIPGEHATCMDGLACGKPSDLAWEVISTSATAYIQVDDQEANEAAAALARTEVSAGPSGAAGLAGLVRAAKDDDMRRAIELTASSRVFLIGTEAAKAS